MEGIRRHQAESKQILSAMALSNSEETNFENSRNTLIEREKEKRSYLAAVATSVNIV